MGEGGVFGFELRLTTGSPSQDKTQIAATNKNCSIAESKVLNVLDGHNIATVQLLGDSEHMETDPGPGLDNNAFHFYSMMSVSFLGRMFAFCFLFLLQRASADVHKLQITCTFVLPCVQDTHSKIQAYRLQSTNLVTVKYKRTLLRPNRRKLQSQTKVILPNQRHLLMLRKCAFIMASKPSFTSRLSCRGPSHARTTSRASFSRPRPSSSDGVSPLP